MAVLGDLEQHVMAVLWRAGEPLSGRDVHERLHYGRDVAYTTVMTVLNRLAKKDVVERDFEGRIGTYRPLKTCVDLHVDEILAMLSGCGEGHAEAILAGVAGRLGGVVQAGQTSCLTTGDPAWTPPADIPVAPASGGATTYVRGGGERDCSFLRACGAAGLACSECPSSVAS